MNASRGFVRPVEARCFCTYPDDVGSLDRPEDTPAGHFGVESRVAWAIGVGLPEEQTNEMF